MTPNNIIKIFLAATLLAGVGAGAAKAQPAGNEQSANAISVRVGWARESVDAENARYDREMIEIQNRREAENARYERECGVCRFEDRHCKAAAAERHRHIEERIDAEAKLKNEKHLRNLHEILHRA
jgi:hypothetical protein